ncbi:MAG TPA: hypothetical protein VJ972_03265 [Anaerolineales bacterium]|nr:hypothetical protein [Anaerolineales bacterium]
MKTTKPFRQKLKSFGIIILILWLGIILWGLIFAWRKVPEYVTQNNIQIPAPIMNNEEYGQVINSHPRPYILNIKAEGGGAVFVYGAEHTKDSNDPQITDIQNQWADFHPTVALIESRLGIMFPGLMDPVETFGEPGIVHALARQDGIPTYTWEPPISVQMESLLNQIPTREQTALYVVLGPAFGARRFGTAEDSERIVAEAINDRSDYPGIENAFESLADVDAAWDKYFPNGPDWRDVSDEFGLPGYLADIDGNIARDEHLVRSIIDLVQKGERVFIVAGSSHSVKIEATLTVQFGK